VVFDDRYGRGVRSVRIRVRDLVSGGSLWPDGRWSAKPYWFDAEFSVTPDRDTPHLADRYWDRDVTSWRVEPPIESLDPSRHAVHVVATDVQGNRATVVLEDAVALDLVR
jgi:hypothetical protein